MGSSNLSLCESLCWSVVQWLQLRNLKKRGEFCAVVSDFEQILSLCVHCSSSLSCMNDSLTIDNGGYVSTKSLHR